MLPVLGHCNLSVTAVVVAFIKMLLLSPVYDSDTTVVSDVNAGLASSEILKLNVPTAVPSATNETEACDPLLFVYIVA